MKNLLKSAGSSNLGLLLARLPVGALFAYAGFFKIAKMGVANFVSKSAGTIPGFLPTPLGRAYLYALPFVELAVGVLIVLGWFTRAAGLIASLILISIMIAVTGVKSEAGGPFHNNVIVLGVTLMLFFAGPGAIALDGVRLGKGNRGDSSKKED